MKRIVKFAQQKTALLLAITFAAILGGATTAVVMAAIPNSQTGQINACYRNQGGPFNPQGSLRVIDSQAGQNCNALETALNWDQEGTKAYTHVLSTETGASLDASRSKNINSFTRLDRGDGVFAYCFNLSVLVKNVNLTPATPFSYIIASVDTTGQEWLQMTNNVCPANTDAVVVPSGAGGGDNFYVSFH